ncbi:TonB-dependent receptor [Pseudomaricurvus alkylphenolicus]|uniref:TonB-dependent receptor n=1 Tax=Pseudomaricurvus alkylphenolicus TaxID=1306991 RepID=UPI00141D7646|nr:TonB-dependent receptor [Pseudomaricurvus alkylphenolicus]NIB45031.1 TonB-dependent receptor [Pseudomaricurvus alkylphenolicus]
MNKLPKLSIAAAMATVVGAGSAVAQENESGKTADALEEVVVTARQRSESLQDVPDAITVFNSTKLETASVTRLEDYVNLSPNIILREGFRAGSTSLTVRGITGAQNGWAPVTYIVDGVKASSQDALNGASLTDIERIEILRGPQGGLYGAGAIAGAINVITKAPTEDPEYAVKLGLGKGNGKTVQAVASGPLGSGESLLYRLNLNYLDTDGLIDDADGDDVDFEEETVVRLRLISKATDDLTLDYRIAYTDIEAGAVTQDRIPGPEYVNDFSSSVARLERGILGSETREFFETALKVDYEFEGAVLSSVTAYSDLEQEVYGTISWANPPFDDTFLGPVFGSGAEAGQSIDNFQNTEDNIETFSQDIRLTSTGDGDFRWVVGAEYLHREYTNLLSLGRIVGPVPGTVSQFVNQQDDREDNLWGVYGQFNWDITDRIELTLAARWDENTYSTIEVDPATGQPTGGIIDPSNGLHVDELEVTDSEFQPKVQVSFDVSEDLTVFGSAGRGFRTGFFNTSSLAAPETSDNYEVGFKSTLADGRMTLNGSIFYTDYSQQQTSDGTDEPPFRRTVNIPESELLGAEVEFVGKLTDQWLLEVGLSYLDSEIEDSGGLSTPAAPDKTANVALQYNHPLDDGLELVARADYRYQGEMYLSLSVPATPEDPFVTTYDITPKEFINFRVGVEAQDWSLALYGKNITNERTAYTTFNIGRSPHYRSFNKPEDYGVEFTLRF